MLDADVVVIGSGFGGAVATLRFAEAGRRVVVLERGDRVSRERFEADPDMLWIPRRHRFGMNDLRGRGRNIIPWLGAAVGGGSHVYAATLKRRADLSDFPASIRDADMSRYYERGERMLGAERYPDYPPYSEVRALEILCRAGDTVAREHPELVEEHGRILLGISFAPPGTPPGAKFVNAHGAEQRYSDPTEPSGYAFHYDGDAFFTEQVWPRLAGLSSAFERCGHVRGWAGLYSVTPDCSGIVGRVAGVSNAIEAHSFTGRGVMQSRAIGRGVAELIVDGRFETLDLSPLDARRFERDRSSWVVEDLHI